MAAFDRAAWQRVPCGLEHLMGLRRGHALGQRACPPKLPRFLVPRRFLWNLHRGLGGDREWADPRPVGGRRIPLSLLATGFPWCPEPTWPAKKAVQFQRITYRHTLNSVQGETAA